MFHLFHISNSNNICQSKINFLSRIWYIFIYFFWPWYLTAAIWKWKSSTRKIVSGTQVWTIHIPFWSSSVQTCGLMFKSNRSFSGNLDLVSGSCRVLKTTWLICGLALAPLNCSELHTSSFISLETRQWQSSADRVLYLNMTISLRLFRRSLRALGVGDTCVGLQVVRDHSNCIASELFD